MKKNILCSLSAFGVLLLAACTGIETFDYTDAPGPMAKFADARTAKATVAVLPFLDQRGIRYDSAERNGEVAGDHGSFYFGLIPLFPFGFVEKTEPENSDTFVSLGRFHFHPQEDLASASAASLKASNLFASVERANSPDQAKTDYLWRGKIENTSYNGRIYSYCITYFFSPILWTVGLPLGTSENELGVTFELVNRKTGEIVWSHHFTGRDSVTHWMYARIGKDVSLYPRLMKHAMNTALRDLSEKYPNL